MRQNIIVIDSNETEGNDFLRGVSESTGKKWLLLVKKNNNRSSAIANIIRYIKYATIPFGLFLRRKRYENIITWQQYYGLFFAFYCRLFHVKKSNKLLVMTFIYKPKKGFVGKIYDSFFEYVVHGGYIDGYTCVAKIECENYSKRFNENINKFHYIRWGLPDYSIQYPSCSSDARYVFSAGRSNRDWPFVFEALGNEDLACVFVCGEGDYAGKYRNIRVERNISDSDYYSLLAKAFCVLISIKDVTISAGQITLIQAMQFGKPVILTQSDGLTNDYVVNGETALVVPKDRGAVIGAIKKLREDEKLYRELAMNGRNLYEKVFSNYRLGIDTGDVFNSI